MYFDITPEVSPSMATFPGDVAFNLKYSKSTKEGDAYSLSSFSSTTHIGAHADAPIHYSKSEETIESRDLNFYLGKCQVIDVSGSGFEISLDKIKDVSVEASRVLFKTDSIKDINQWQDDFGFVSHQVVSYLAD